jgi:hypothetical protein
MSHDQAGPGGAGQDGDADCAAEFVERVDQRRPQPALGRLPALISPKIAAAAPARS